jgi:hypothetical protein
VEGRDKGMDVFFLLARLVEAQETRESKSQVASLQAQPPEALHIFFEQIFISVLRIMMLSFVLSDLHWEFREMLLCKDATPTARSHGFPKSLPYSSSRTSSKFMGMIKGVLQRRCRLQRYSETSPPCIYPNSCFSSTQDSPC